jgi:ATP phosphoribosyltransferase regulatory subunit
VGRVKAAISNKNYVGLQELLDEFKVSEGDKDRFMRIITTHGGRGVIQEARSLARNAKTLGALDILDQVYEALEAYEITSNVELNLGILRGLDYYTGIVFEGYSSYIGFPILGGGRYDNLMGQFGLTCPATGFALGMERLLLSLEKGGSTPEFAAEPDYVIFYQVDQAATAFKKARELREAGFVVVTHQANENDTAAESFSAKTIIAM